jgi:hypothetical protein
MADYPIRIRTGVTDRVLQQGRKSAKDNLNDTNLKREVHLEAHLS